MFYPYKTLGFVQSTPPGSTERTMSVHVRLHNGDQVEIPLEIPPSVTRIYYLQPSSTMVAPRDQVVADAPSTPYPFARVGALVSEYRRFTQWELDRYCSMNPLSPIPISSMNIEVSSGHCLLRSQVVDSATLGMYLVKGWCPSNRLIPVINFMIYHKFYKITLNLFLLNKS